MVTWAITVHGGVAVVVVLLLLLVVFEITAACSLGEVKEQPGRAVGTKSLAL